MPPDGVDGALLQEGVSLTAVEPHGEQGAIGLAGGNVSLTSVPTGCVKDRTHGEQLFRGLAKEKTTMLRTRLAVLACLLVPSISLAASTDADPLHSLRQQVAALQLDHALNLTQAQAKALLPLLQDAQSKVKAAKAQWTASQPAMVAAFTQAVADLKANGAVSDATLQAAQAARGTGAGTLRQDMKAIWQQAKQILSADQVQTLKTVKLGLGRPAPAADAGKPAGGHGPGRRFHLMHAFLSDSFVSLVQARAG